jgi:hypothetical protein
VRKALAIVTVACVVAGAALTGCSSVSVPGGDTGLSRALARVAANSATRTFVSYDDTAALTKLVGKQPAVSGFGVLLLGVPILPRLLGICPATPASLPWTPSTGSPRDCRPRP